MASPIPKPAATRQRRNKTATARTLIAPTAPFVIPDLPDGYDKRTLRWWETVKTSPMRDEYTETDWQGLLMVAALVNCFWFSNDGASAAKAASEVRMQEREYGLTPMARRSLQWEIARGEEAERRRSQVRAPVPTIDPRLRVIEGNGHADRNAAPETALADPRPRRGRVH